MTLLDLLHFARVIKFHNFHRVFVLEIGHGRIIERDVSVFPDAETTKVHRLGF